MAARGNPLRATPFAHFPAHSACIGTWKRRTSITNYLIHLSTAADSKRGNRSWVNIQSAGWVNIQSARTGGTSRALRFDRRRPGGAAQGAGEPAVPRRAGPRDGGRRAWHNRSHHARGRVGSPTGQIPLISTTESRSIEEFGLREDNVAKTRCKPDDTFTRTTHPTTREQYEHAE